MFLQIIRPRHIYTKRYYFPGEKLGFEIILRITADSRTIFLDLYYDSTTIVTPSTSVSLYSFFVNSLKHCF